MNDREGVLNAIEEVLSNPSPRNYKSKDMACFCVWQPEA